MAKTSPKKRKAVLLGVGLDGDGHKRVTTGPNFALVGGSADTHEQSERDAHSDALTSLPNRALFNNRIEHGMALSRRHGWMLAVLFIDLDNFKGINDVYGHSAGDQMLQAIGTRLKSVMRADDTVSRHGGDEFLYLLLEVMKDNDVEIVAQKIIKTISEPCNLFVDGVAISSTVTPSIGVAMFPRDGQTAEDLVKSADVAMYQAKLNKTGHCFYRSR